MLGLKKYFKKEKEKRNPSQDIFLAMQSITPPHFKIQCTFLGHHDGRNPSNCHGINGARFQYV